MKNRYRTFTKIINFFDRIINIIIKSIFIFLLSYSLFGLYDTYNIYTNSGKNNEIAKLRPIENEQNESTNENQSEKPGKDGLAKLKSINKDICGWLIIEGTNIDYPILQAEDNSKYLNNDYEGNYSVLGSVFMDYRNQSDFSDFYTLVYAHSMKGDNMFGKIPQFLKKDFFEKNRYGILFSENGQQRLMIFASVYTDAFDRTFYNPLKSLSSEQKKHLISYIKNNARQYRNLDIKMTDHIIGMSTCASASEDGRIIVFAKILESDTER